MTDQPPVTDLDAYLRQYKDRFTRDAMAAKLIEAGHDPDAVEAAMARVEAEREARLSSALAAADAEEQRAGGARTVTRVIVLGVYVAICLWILATLGAGGGGTTGLQIFIVLMVGVGLLLAWLINRTRSVPVMVVWCLAAVLLGLPLAFFGACLVGLSTGTFI